MIRQGTRKSFEDYAAGLIPFSTFARQTREFWVALAKYLMGRWRAPDAVEPDDLVQELLTEAWRAFPKYDPLRGPVTEFVCYEATSKAKRWLHGQRGRRRCSRSDKLPSRNPIRFADLSADGDATAFLEFLFEVDTVIPQDRWMSLLDAGVDVLHKVQLALLRGHLSAEELRLLRAFVHSGGNMVETIRALQAGHEGEDVEGALLKTVCRAMKDSESILDWFEEAHR